MVVDFESTYPKKLFKPTGKDFGKQRPLFELFHMQENICQGIEPRVFSSFSKDLVVSLEFPFVASHFDLFIINSGLAGKSVH